MSHSSAPLATLWPLVLILGTLVLSILPCITAQELPRRLQVPGVAFGLTPNYGTAAIYFANESFVEVAQIEGSPEYKNFMRKEASSTPSLSQCDKLPASLQRIRLGPCARQPDSTSAVALLRALKYSVESYFGSTFCFADIVLPDPNQTYQRGVLENAIQAVGLRQSLQTLHAGKLALIANHLSRPVEQGATERVVLSIDYSGSGLNTVLFCDDQGIIDSLRQVYSPALGAEKATIEHWEAVRMAIHKFIEPPFGLSPTGRKLPNRIDKLVLYGDHIVDPEFLKVLWDVLEAELIEKAHAFDPIFASAVGMAQASHENMDDIYFNVKPAFGCRWRSKLYEERRKEL